jgi:hypothetical protein
MILSEKIRDISFRNHNLAVTVSSEELKSIADEVAELEAENKRLMAVFEAAHGLCCGVDWNKGTHAILHGYRKKLIDAVRKFREI